MLTQIKAFLKDTWLHPRHLAQREIARFVQENGAGLHGLLLDVGCGQKPYRGFLPNIRRHVGIDMPGTSHGSQHSDVMASALALPFASSTFDSILCTEVLEHTPDPALGLREMARVARPGAILLMTVPMSEQLHEEPFDYCRFTRHWLRYLLEATGWRVERIQERGGAWLDLGYRFSTFLYTSGGATVSPSGHLRPRPLLGPLVVILCAGVQLIASGLNRVWPSRLSTMGYGVLAMRD